jgi:hypothetical protein
MPKDSIVFIYQNPLNPTQQLRRSYPYIDFTNFVGITPHNDVAKTAFDPGPGDGRQWILSDAPGLVRAPIRNAGACCRVLPGAVNSSNPDSSSAVGIIVEASREFTLDMKVFSNLGQVVNRVSFTVPRSEFLKLTLVPGKDTRYLRLLWNGLSESGECAGTGAYIFKTSITLLPFPGIAQVSGPTQSIRRFGILRGKE